MESYDPELIHQPVMPDECLRLLKAADGGLFVDATLGLGGHSEKILEASENSTVVGIDQDQNALDLASSRLACFGSRFTAVKANFSTISQVLSVNERRPNGILADLGVSSLQLDSESRGFSFRFNAPLDMRMDPDSGGETVSELLARVGQEELANVIYQFGEERASRKIARWIIEKRENGAPIATTFELAELVRRAVKTSPKDRTHPATRTFQALRIAVNHELEILQRFIADSIELLDDGGILAILTFHSLEDRIVKQTFQLLAGKCQCPPRIPQCACGAAKKVGILTRKPLVPGEDEKSQNPRSRSAKLRACKKIGQ